MYGNSATLLGPGLAGDTKSRVHVRVTSLNSSIPLHARTLQIPRTLIKEQSTFTSLGTSQSLSVGDTIMPRIVVCSEFPNTSPTWSPQSVTGRRKRRRAVPFLHTELKQSHSLFRNCPNQVSFHRSN